VLRRKFKWGILWSKNGIFDNNDNEIANDITKKVKSKEDIEKSKTKKKDKFELK